MLYKFSSGLLETEDLVWQKVISQLFIPKLVLGLLTTLPCRGLGSLRGRAQGVNIRGIWVGQHINYNVIQQ